MPLNLCDYRSQQCTALAPKCKTWHFWQHLKSFIFFVAKSNINRWKSQYEGVEGGHLFSLIGRIICFGAEGSFPWEQFVAVFLLHFGSLPATRLATHPLIKCGSEKRESITFYIHFVIFAIFYIIPIGRRGGGVGFTAAMNIIQFTNMLVSLTHIVRRTLKEAFLVSKIVILDYFSRELPF